MIKVAVFGAKGRMGTAVCQAVEEAEDTELVAAVDSGGDRSDASGADVIVDFTTCLLYTSPSPRDVEESRMPSSA